MSIATEISIPIIVNGAGGLANSSCGLSQGVFDATTLRSTLDGVYSGSWPGPVHPWDLLDLRTGGFLTGSWPGNVNMWGNRVIASGGTNTGSWPGNNNNWDLYSVPVDNHSTDVISNNQVNATQSSILVEWNHFPFPPPVPEPPQKVRDLTRFQKAYSFQRQQPVRIRLYRK